MTRLKSTLTALLGLVAAIAAMGLLATVGLAVIGLVAVLSVGGLAAVAIQARKHAPREAETVEV